MVMESRHGLTRVGTKVIILKVKNMGEESICGLMGLRMKESGVRIKSMEMECTNG